MTRKQLDLFGNVVKNYQSKLQRLEEEAKVKEREVELFYKASDGEEFKTKEDFVEYISNTLKDPDYNFRHGFEILHEVKDKPEMIQLIKSEILDDEIYLIEHFDTLTRPPGEYIYAAQAKDWDDPGGLMYNGYLYPEDYFKHTIEETGNYKIYVNHSDGDELYYMAGVDNEDDAIDIMIFERFEKAEVLDRWAQVRSKFSYKGFDTQIRRALEYLELRWYYRYHMNEMYIEKDQFNQKLDQEKLEQKLVKNLFDALNSEDISNVIRVLSDTEFEKLIKMVYKNTERNRAFIRDLVSITARSEFFTNLSIWNLELELNEYELLLLEEFAMIIREWEHKNFQ